MKLTPDKADRDRLSYILSQYLPMLLRRQIGQFWIELQYDGNLEHTGNEFPSPGRLPLCVISLDPVIKTDPVVIRVSIMSKMIPAEQFLLDVLHLELDKVDSKTVVSVLHRRV